MQYYQSLIDLLEPLLAAMSMQEIQNFNLVSIGLVAFALGLLLSVARMLRKVAVIAIIFGVLSMFGATEVIDTGVITGQVSGAMDTLKSVIGQ